MGFSKSDMYTEVTEAIVASLEKALATGSVPAWIKPWKSAGAYRNAFTNRPYRGVNTIILGFKQFADPRWATFNQIKKHGGMVRKGEKATAIIFWKFLKKEQPDGTIKTIPLLKSFNVFNVEQADGLELKPIAPATDTEANPEAEAALQTILGKVHYKYGGDLAAYSQTLDTLVMPERGSFTSPNAFYGTWFHELGHWTGHKDRLNRDLTGRYGSEAYAVEELVAELASAFLCRDLRVNGAVTNNTTAYIGSWLKVLKNDNHMIFKASSLAEKAADLIKQEMEVTAQAEEETEEEAVTA